MKFYDCSTAPSPRRVRIFMAEKGIEIPTVQVDLRNGEQFSDWFRALNPKCVVPVLELDDGTPLCEITAICRYLEELHPEPPLMGVDAKDRAIVEMWQRRVEFDGLMAVAEAFRNATPAFAERAMPGPRKVAQIPELAARGRERFGWFMEDMDARLADSEFIAGPRYTIADISAMVAIDFAGWSKITIPESRGNLQRWHEAVSARPSAKA